MGKSKKSTLTESRTMNPSEDGCIAKAQGIFDGSTKDFMEFDLHTAYGYLRSDLDEIVHRYPFLLKARVTVFSTGYKITIEREG